MKAVIISKNGGPEVLELKDIKLGEPKSGEVLIKNEAIRSKTVKVANTNKKSNYLIDKLINQNLIIGKGYGNNDYQIRIANFPTHSKENIEMLCDIISRTEF